MRKERQSQMGLHRAENSPVHIAAGEIISGGLSQPVPRRESAKTGSPFFLARPLKSLNLVPWLGACSSEWRIRIRLGGHVPAGLWVILLTAVGIVQRAMST